MRILLTNDDGLYAEGMSALVDVARQFGEVKVVAPDRERSACGHSMTLRDPLRAQPVDYDGLAAWEVSGVPVDCVNVGLELAWPEGCDLVLSGFNHGPNLGFDVTYSGTVAGAMEGCINGIHSISLSMALFVSGAPLHFETGIRWAQERLGTLIEHKLPPLTFFNVNVPAIAYEELRGERVVGMGQRVYQECLEIRSDPWGRPYYWQGGVVAMSGDQAGTDVEAVSEGFVSITPVSLDWTNHGAIKDVEAALNR
jgi:5'-nucleotidase